MKRRLLSIALFLSLIGSAFAQQGIPRCAPHDEMLNTLWTRFQEKVVMSGYGSDGRIVEITASASGTWTALIIDFNNQACMAADGTEFELFDWPPAREAKA